MPNMRILAQAVLKISCSQCFSIVIMAESKKGHNFVIQGPTKKSTFSLILCPDATNKISSS